jgi:hypothetical protein
VYLAKTLYLGAADSTHQWWWSIVLQAGGVLTGAYLVMVIARGLAPAGKGAASRVGAIPRRQQAAALALVLASLSLGLLPWHAWLPLPAAIVEAEPLSFGALWSLVWPLLIGAVVAMLLGRRENQKPLRLSSWLEQADDALRHWPVASIAFLVVTALLGIAILVSQ